MFDFDLASILKIAGNSFGKWMLREFLQTIKDTFCVFRQVIPYHRADLWLTFSHSSGLIKYNGVYFLGCFQTFGIFYQNASFRTFADTYHNGGGGRQAQGAWASDN